MRIEYVHASKYGNGAMVAEEFARRMSERGVDVSIHHVRDVRPDELRDADLYLFSSPGRMGRPIGSMRRFLKKLALPAGTHYALLTTEGAPRPDKKTGRTPTDEEVARHEHVRPLMHQILQAEGLVGVGEEHVYVTGMRGPLEDGWKEKVDEFADRIPLAA